MRLREIPTGVAAASGSTAGAILAAAALAAEADLVVVGGAALVLDGRAERCGDLDVVPDPRPESLERLRAALAALGASPFPRDLDGRELVSVTSPFGRIDVMLATALREHDALRRDAHVCWSAGVAVTVAALEDVMRLRARFMEGSAC